MAERVDTAEQDSSAAASIWPSGHVVKPGVRQVEKLHGWLNKYHVHQSSLKPSHAQRFVFEDANGMLCYSHKDAPGSVRKVICHLLDITNLELANYNRPEMYDDVAMRCFSLTYAAPGCGSSSSAQLMFSAEDREGARMWVDQLTLRVQRWRTNGRERPSPMSPRAQSVSRPSSANWSPVAMARNMMPRL